MKREAPVEIEPSDRLDRLAATIGRGEIPPRAAKFLALQLVGATTVERDLGPDLDGNISLVVGLPATTNDSLVAGRVADLSPHSEQVSGTNATRAGVIASYQGQKVSLGPALKSDLDLLVIEQANELDEVTTRALAEIMKSGRLQITKDTINTTVPQSASYLLLRELEYGYPDEFASMDEQIGVAPHLVAASDATIPGFGDDWRDDATPLDGDIAREIVEEARSVSPDWGRNTRSMIEEIARRIWVKIEEDRPLTAADESRTREALWKFSEAIARLKAHTEVAEEDVTEAKELYEDNLEALGATGEDEDEDLYGADVVETGSAKTQRDRIKNVRGIIADLETEYDEGAPIPVVLERAKEVGIDESKAKHEIDKLKQRGELYEPSTDHLRTS